MKRLVKFRGSRRFIHVAMYLIVKCKYVLLLGMDSDG